MEGERRVRRRGFLPGGDVTEAEATDHESPEGVVIRVRMRERPRRPRRRLVHATVRGRGAAIKSASATGIRRPSRSPR